MNKLFVLKIDRKVIAITEYKSHMRLFILQNNYSRDQYILKTYTDQHKINHYLTQYEDEYLTEYKNFIVRSSDIPFINDMIDQYRQKIRSTIESLESIDLECIMSPKQHSKIGKVIKLLHAKSKKKNIDDFINIHYLIKTFCTNHNMRYDLRELSNRYRHNIEKE